MAAYLSVASTKEKTNYARLCRLLVEVGSQALRDEFNKIHPPASLYRVLTNCQAKLNSLGSKRILSPIQWGKLYPAIPSSVSSANFDITILCVLLRNICGLLCPATGWNNPPVTTDKSLAADVLRLKHYRNTVYAHVAEASVDDANFNSYWDDIRDVLVRLGGSSYAVAITKLKTECMDPAVEEHYKELLKQWKKNDENLLDELAKINNKVDTIDNKVESVHKMVCDLKDAFAVNGMLPMVVKLDGATFRNTGSEDHVDRENRKRQVMSEMCQNFFESMAKEIPSEHIPHCLLCYLQSNLELKVKEATEGSLRITVQCYTLEILERLWEDYNTGHLNAVAEECLLTDDIKRRFDVVSVKLKTTILEKDYLACKSSLISQRNPDSPLQEGELLPRDQIQSASETQIHAANETEAMTVNLSGNYRGDLPNIHEENRLQLEEEIHELVSGELLPAETANIPVSEFRHPHHLVKVIHVPRPGDEREGEMKIAIEFRNPESLERLWEDYCSGHLNTVAEKYLLTDDIKERFGVESVKIETTILEEDYLACKEFLLKKPRTGGTNYVEFNALLLQIADEITKEELMAMKFLCLEPNYNLPRGKLDRITEPRHFVNFLRERGKIWPEDLSYLVWLLEAAGKIQLAEMIKERVPPGTPSSPGVGKPGILPCLTTHFIGRDADVYEIIKKLRTDTFRMVVVISPPGMGKTEVAISASEMLQREGDLTVVFVERKDRLIDICGEILDRLSSRRWSVSVDLITQAKRKLSELQVNTVIVLHNTEDVQGEEFDDFAGWLVKSAPKVQLVITTRQDVGFVSADIHKVHLKPLDVDSSTKLLRELVASCCYEYAKELGELCGGIPLLLIHCACLLNSDFNPEVLIQELKENPIRLLKSNATEVYNALGRFIGKFSEDLKRNLVVLSVFPSFFSTKDIQFLFEDQLQLETVKRRMIQCSILQKASSQKFNIHPLVQAYCRAERASLNMVDAGRDAQRKFNCHYLELVENLSKQFISKNSALIAIKTFRKKKANILEAIYNCLKDTSDVDQRELAIDVANSTEVLDFLAKVLTPPEECAKLYRKCCDIAKTSSDKKRHAESLNSLGFRRLCDVAHSKDDPEGCRVTLEVFLEAYDICKTLPEEDQKCQTHAHTISKLGLCSVLQGEEEKGRALIKEAIAMREDLGVPLYVAAGYCDLGNSYRLCGDYKTAIEIWKMHTLPVYKQELGDHPWTASILHYIADSYKALATENTERGYADHAEMYFRQSLELRERLLGFHPDTARSHVFLSDVLAIQGEFPSALEQLEKALEIQKDLLGPQHKITTATLNKITDVLARLSCKEETRKT